MAVRGRTINYSLSEAATLTTVDPPGSQGARQVQAPDAPQPQPAALLALRHAAGSFTDAESAPTRGGSQGGSAGAGSAPGATAC